MAKTNFTIDSDAQYVNKTFLDPINHFAQCGNILKNILVVRFKGNVKAFRKYVKHNLNVSCQSAFRYISLFENYEAVDRKSTRLNSSH